MALTPPQHPRANVIPNLGNTVTVPDKIRRLPDHDLFIKLMLQSFALLCTNLTVYEGLAV